MNPTPMPSAPPVSRIILYVKDIPKCQAWYQKHFGLEPLPGAMKGWVELASPAGGCTIALHQASVGQKSGAAMKIVFAVLDVRAFKAAREKEGLNFGSVHDGGGLVFCNAKDPNGNSVQISNRGVPE